MVLNCPSCLSASARGIEGAFHRRLGQQISVVNHLVDGVDAGIEVVLDLVEVAAIVVGNLLGDIAGGDTLHIGGRDGERCQNQVQNLVDLHTQRLDEAVGRAGVDAPREVAILHRLHDRVDFVDGLFLDRAIDPLHDRAEPLAAGAFDRVDAQQKMAIPQLQVRLVGVFQLVENAALMLGSR